MRLVIALILLASFGCSQAPTDPDAGPGTATLRYGQTATIAGTRVSFTDVVEDSRCPKDVVCAWAGDAAIRFESGGEALVLHTNAGVGASSGKLGSVTVTLVEVRPDPVSTSPTKKTDYIVTIRASE